MARGPTAASPPYPGHLDGESLAGLSGQTSRRAVDVAVAAVALAVVSPVLAVVAALIRLTSPGPVIYRARRAGLHGQPITVLKFRTMRVDGDGGGAITADGDPRVYPLGSWLRRSKIDELPQLVNVLRGDMSIIGPRPEDPRIVAAHYREEHLQTLGVPPGLTSPGSLYSSTHAQAALTGPDPDAVYAERVLPVKLALDLVYLRRRCLRYDLGVVARTAWVVGALTMGRRRFPDPPELAEAERLYGCSANGHGPG
jgi:lipopolysaccharide/colanic/teichoic acid biosynthesis glycosyltransferase